MLSTPRNVRKKIPMKKRIDNLEQALRKFAKEENWGLKDGKWYFDGQSEFSFFEKQPYKIAKEALKNADRS